MIECPRCGREFKNEIAVTAHRSKTSCIATPEERYWSKVDRRGPAECWLWLGATRDGYGQFSYNGRWVLATHVALALAGRPLRDGEDALHSCNNPPCVNPAHLRAGDDAANVADMIRDGRHGRWTMPERNARGEQNGRSKLTRDQVVAIRDEAASGASEREIARRYGINRGTTHRIVSRRSWRSV